MKRILAVFLTVIVFLTMIPLGSFETFAQTDTGTVISVESTSAVVDSTVDVAVNISGNTGIASMGISLEFDENLTLVEASNGEAFSDLTFIPPAQLKKGNSITGSCNFSWVASENAVDDGTILNLKFKVSKDSELNKDCNIKITCENDNILDKSKNPVNVEVKNGKITVIDYIPGDVDGSGSINMLDVLSLCQFYVDGCKYDPAGYGIDIKKESGDVDANGKINMLDVLMICQYYVDGCKYDANGYAVKLLPGKTACVHTLVKTQEVVPTCTEDGNITYWHCTKCGEYYSDAEASNVISYESTIVKGKHNEIVKEAVPATYTSEGYTEGIWCDKCNTWLSGHEKLDPIKVNTKSITYNIKTNPKYPYLKTLDDLDESELVDVSKNKEKLDYSYEPGKSVKLREIDLSEYGYKFLGWYNGYTDDATPIKEISASSNEDIVLYAHVEEIQYSITYNMYQTPVSGTPTDEQKKYTVSEGNSNLFDPIINNYEFLGWYDNSGVEYKTIPAGTTGNITLNAYYTSYRNFAVSKVDENPIILEDQNTNTVYFTYEIGEIRNIPLNGDDPFWVVQSVAGLSQKKSETHTKSITGEEAKIVSKTISDMTTNSGTWTLSNSWNNITTVNETWAESLGKTSEQCKTEATTTSNTLSLTDQYGGSSYHKTEDGATVYDYNSKTVTEDKGHQFDVSLNGNYTNKIEASLGASTEYGATDSYGYTSKSNNKDVLSSGIKYENGFEFNAGMKYAYHNNTNTVTKTGTDTVTTNSSIDENTSSWNSTAGFSSTQQHSSSQSVRNVLSDIITTTKGYGSSYSNGGTDTETQGFSSTASNTTGTTSSVTYGKQESETIMESISVDGKIEGKYRSILVGTAHVFAVVGYDYATKSFFTYTFSVMDDKVNEWLDYTPAKGNFDDCEYSCLPFEVPGYVFDYVSDKTSKTTGIQYITDSMNGTAKITGYTGDSNDVIIPSYVSDGKQAYKVTEISAGAFAGKPVRSVVLGEFIENIPAGAFKNCTSLEEVIGSFTEIEDEAFAGCTSLTNMNIPSNVVKIGKNAFDGAKSITVRAINSLASYTEASQQLTDGTDEQIKEKQKEITQDFIGSVLECGAQNIDIDLSYVVSDMQLSLNVPEIDSIAINGGTRTWENFYIDSAAKNTVLNEMTIVSNGTPLKVNSDKLTLHKIFANGTSTALILGKDGAVVSLVQDSSIKTTSDYAVLGKNIVIESQVTAGGAVGYLNVTKNIGYVNSVNGLDYVNISDGEAIKLSEEDFDKYLKGRATVTYDANEGDLGNYMDTGTAFYGEEFGELPLPTRDYYSFIGWFTEKEGGTEVTESTVVSSTDDITLYAHWEIKPLSDWVKSSEIPEGAEAVEKKYNYNYTSTASLGASSDYTILNESSYWSDYGSWSSWSRSVVYSSDSRQTETKTVTDSAAYTKYKYYIYRSSDGYAAGTKNYVTKRGKVCNIYDEVYLTYQLNKVTSGEWAGCYGPYDSSMFSHSGDCYWFYGGATDVAAVIHTEYRYRDRHMIYSYTIESSNNPTGQSGVSDIVEYVKYREK